MFRDKKGFTLIELLVVIAIIGILSSVVLASLNAARNRGADAAIKSTINNVRAEAELYYDTEGDYDGLCATLTEAEAAVENAGTSDTGWVCQTTPTTGAAYAITGALKTEGHYCVDSTGVARDIAAALPANTYACPAN